MKWTWPKLNLRRFNAAPRGGRGETIKGAALSGLLHNKWPPAHTLPATPFSRLPIYSPQPQFSHWLGCICLRKRTSSDVPAPTGTACARPAIPQRAEERVKNLSSQTSLGAKWRFRSCLEMLSATGVNHTGGPPQWAQTVRRRYYITWKQYNFVKFLWLYWYFLASISIIMYNKVIKVNSYFTVSLFFCMTHCMDSLRWYFERGAKKHPDCT